MGDRGGYLDEIRIVAADVPEGRGPTGRAVFEGRYFICGDIEIDPLMRPWKEKALGHGFRSSAAFPLRIGPEVIGAFTLYSEKPRFLTQEEIELRGDGDRAFDCPPHHPEARRQNLGCGEGR